MDLHSGGYYRVSINGIRKLEHRYIMEQYLDRELLDIEQVHHINKIKTDNRIENLQLTTRWQHPEHHHKDMTNRKCLICGSSKTYFDKCFIWYKRDDGFVCAKCDRRLRRSL